jgi:hypothetical protein
MASQVLTDARLLVAGRDFSGQMNALALTYAAEMLDETTFGNDTRINKGGLKGIVGQHEGYWDATDANAPDPVLFDLVGGAGTPVIICGVAGDEGDPAYLFEAVAAEYTPGAAIGELLGFSVSMEGGNGLPLVRGTILADGAETGNVTGTAFQLGAVGASQFLYAALQVYSGTGEFIAKVQSATDEAFTSPNDRITFATIATGTAVASEWATPVAGSITDTWWRVTATNPNTRNFTAAVGIL